MTWEEFILEHGAKMRAADLAFILGQSEKEIEKVRARALGQGQATKVSYADAFAIWHGRPPQDNEWPPPRKRGGMGYEWQGRELTLLAGLTGTMTKAEIARLLTKRLRHVTGDARARRNEMAVQDALARIGLRVGDLIGGVNPSEAGKEVGSINAIYQAIRRGHLRVERVGRLMVIPHEAWRDWKAKRTPIPEGYVRLSSIKTELAIKSDKLSEFARMGYIPSAIQCNLYGSKGDATQGVWYIAREAAEKLIADRRAGLAMPWHGKPMPDNLLKSWGTWLEKRHSDTCKGCREIWGAAGAPETFEEFAVRYPPLSHGAKRHLTFTFKPGLSVKDLVKESGCSTSTVHRAIGNGALRATGKPFRIARIDATRWIARNKPTGVGPKSWISFASARKWYDLDAKTIENAIAEGSLKSRRITNGPCYGQTFVSRQQCRELRDQMGYTLEQVADKFHMSMKRAHEVLCGLDWRGGDRIAPETVSAMKKRLQAKFSITIEEAAEKIGESVEWVHSRIAAGLVKTRRARWYPDKQTLSARDVAQLSKLKNKALPEPKPLDWLRATDAVARSGVCQTTLLRWVNEGSLKTQLSARGRLFDSATLDLCARNHWTKHRNKNRRKPAAFEGVGANTNAV